MGGKIIGIAAMDEDRIIGNNGWMPWYKPEDLEWFKKHVQDQICIMGRKTYEGFKEHLHTNGYRYAKKNLIFSNSMLEAPGLEIIHSVEELKQKYGNEIIWVIGGAKTYKTFMPYFDELYITLVQGNHEGDTKMPKIPPYQFYKETIDETKNGLEFQKYTRITGPEALAIMQKNRKSVH